MGKATMVMTKRVLRKVDLMSLMKAIRTNEKKMVDIMAWPLGKL